MMAATCWAAAPKAGVTIDKQDVVVETRHFDPANKPKEMPPIKPPEVAVADSQVQCEVGAGYNVTVQSQSADQTVVRIRVTSVQVKLGLKIVLWLPNGVDARTKAHEEGHQRISEKFYANAHETARSMAAQYIGQTAVGKGDSVESAGNAAIQPLMQRLSGQYMDAVYKPLSRVQAIYDQITDHGRKKIKEDDAIEQAMARWEKEGK
jgi:hypothetical protein